MLDTLIQGGTLVDGTGRPARTADVGIRDGRIVSIGATDELAARTIDATGLVVSPGFVDLHTHYDAQLLWDPLATPSPFHGVTSVLGGNCGFTLAPAGPDHAEYLMRLMARVEGIPIEALSSGLAWDWTTFEDYLANFDDGIGVNAGFLVGHCALRRAVMGEASVGEAASPTQIDAMAQLLHHAIEAGALGFSTSQAMTHNDGAGDPVPSRWAQRDELLALAGACREHTGTTIEMILAGVIRGFSDEEIALMADMSLAANRPVNWNALGVTSRVPDRHISQLRSADVARARGAEVVGLVLGEPQRNRISFHTGFVLDGLPGWRATFALPPAQRIEALRDPEVRRHLAAGASSPEVGGLARFGWWDQYEIVEAVSPNNRRYDGRVVGDIARERGVDAFDALLDIVIDDGLKTGLLQPPVDDSHEDWKLRAEAWLDSRTIVGGSDSGAHLDMICGATATTAVLSKGVREHQVITMEDAIHQLSDVPARLYGLRDRGRVAEGYHADIVLFDGDRVAARPAETRHDLPGGALRLYAEAVGIERVLVNGVDLVVEGRATGARPGKLLKSGRDTDSVTVPGGQS